MSKLFLLLLIPILIYSQPKDEVRAVWLTTVFNLDWPTSFSNPSAQQNEMRQILDILKQANFNTIMFQVRGRGDLMYPSSIEPYARSLTGSLGGNPGYDPLQFVINEAHQRGMEVHAWWNVYKVYGDGNPPSTNPPHVVNARPELCKIYPTSTTSEWWMDPGMPETKNYLLNLAMEMVRGYNIDAIHFDFIRYPNPDFDDNATYQQYGQGIPKADWRRNNITQFVSALYDSVQAVKPMMKVGSAPIGIYKDLTPCLSGWDGYSQVYQDAVRWLLLKKHDYHAPQVYWDINSCPRFDSLAQNWILNRAGRHMYPGMAAYRMGPNDGNWPSSEILAQLDSSRVYGGQGQVYFRTNSFRYNWKGIMDALKASQYKYPANIPSMPWKDSVKANSPVDFTITTSDSLTYTLSWSKPAPAADGDTAVYYNVYKDDSYPVDYSDVKNMIAFRVVNDTSVEFTVEAIPTENVYFAVTAYDKGYNESLPAEAAIMITNIEDENIITGFRLDQNYPNPFNPVTNLGFRISNFGFVSLKVYDILGKEVAVLVNAEKEAGEYEIEFNAETLSSGIYYYTLKSGSFISTRKMILMK